MDYSSSLERFSVNRYLYYLTGLGIASFLILVTIIIVSINISSGLRAYVAGEGYWSKAQKDASLSLQKYIYTGEEFYYNSFNDYLSVILGDRLAREELSKDNFDYQVAYDGFLKGKNHPGDIPNLIFLFRKFSWYPEFKKVIAIWTEGDKKIDELIALGEEVDKGFVEGDLSEEQKRIWSERLFEINNELTRLELSFSDTVNELAKLTGKLIKISNIIIVIIVVGMGVFFGYSFMKSTESWANSLKASEEQFRHVVDNSRDVLFEFDYIEDRFVYISPSLVDVLGYEPEEWIKGGRELVLNLIHPDDLDSLVEEISKFNPNMKEGDYSSALEFRIRNKEGKYRWVNMRQKLVSDKNGLSRAMVVNLRDVTQRSELYEALRKSHDEKDLLLREIHHRIKNNLSIIFSILQLHKSDTKTSTKEILEACQNKIMSISMIHEKLYKSEDLGKIRMDSYLQNLINELVGAYSSKHVDVRVQLNLEPFELKVDQAIPCGLVLSEVITNVYKHGFKNRNKGELIISSVKEKEGDMVTITVENNGNPFVENFSEDHQESFGIKMIRAVLEVIDGSYEVEGGKYTKVTIRFPAMKTVEQEPEKSQML